MTSDYLMGTSTAEMAQAELEDRELLRLFQEIEKVPEEDKQAVKKVLEAFLIKRQVLSLASRQPLSL